MNDLYEALEICLQELEQGADVETVLFRYPDLAEELRPILEGSIHAQSMAIVAPPVEVVRRNRAKVLQHAAQMREAKKSSQRVWFASLRRIAVTLAVVAALFISGTGLVRAASTTLPGDNLYPVKRTWEDVLLLFTLDLQEREALEIEHENERLHELMELFAQGLSAEVDFAGRVTSQNGNEWTVNGVRVRVSTQTEVRDGPIAIGSAVRVRGWTQGNGTVLAERVRVLSTDDKLPDVEYEDKEEDRNDNDNEGSSHPRGENSGPGSGNESPDLEEMETPESDSGSGDESSNSGSDNENSGSEDGGDDNQNNSGSDNADNKNDDHSGSNDGGNDNSDDNSGSDDSNDNSSNDGNNDDSNSNEKDNSGPGGGDD